MGDISRSPCVTSASLPRVFTTFLSVPMRTCYLFSTSIASRDSNPDKKVLIFFPLRSMFYRFRADITPPVLPIGHTCKNRKWENRTPVSCKCRRSATELNSKGVRPPTRGQTLDREMWGFLPKCTRVESNRLYSTITDGCTLMKGGLGNLSKIR